MLTIEFKVNGEVVASLTAQNITEEPQGEPYSNNDRRYLVTAKSRGVRGSQRLMEKAFITVQQAECPLVFLKRLMAALPVP